MIQNFPILAICGYSGAGKTTLIERVVSKLSERQLKVAVIKHDVHGIDIDRPGKDSHTFFQAGADVLLQGPREEFFRRHVSDERNQLSGALQLLATRYDLVIVEGHKTTPLPKVWLLGDKDEDVPGDLSNNLAVLPRNCDRLEMVLPIVENILSEQWQKIPVYGCVLIGGKSRRMGAPKHLLLKNNETWLAQTVELLRPATQKVVVAGTGELPESLTDLVRLIDVPDAEGPMAGLLAAMRWARQASWLVVACDLPALCAEAIDWLLSLRSPGLWAILPKLAGSAGIEPLFGYYDFRSRQILERQVAEGNFRLSEISLHPRVISPEVPSHLAHAWRNVNFPADLKSCDRTTSRGE